MYGTRGATFLTNGLEVSQFHQTALHILSLSISYLDKVKFYQSKKSYALPFVYQSTCLYGKPYHYCMAAYIARYSKSQQFGSLSSFGVSAALGMAYDIITDYNGRNPDDIFKKPLYSNYLNSKRIDNAWRTLVAYYGTRFNSIKRVNQVDSILESSFNNAKEPSNDIKEEKIKIKRLISAWISLVSPQSILRRLWLIN